MLEIGTSGSVGGEGGNILAYLADPRGFAQMGPRGSQAVRHAFDLQTRLAEIKVQQSRRTVALRRLMHFIRCASPSTLGSHPQRAKNTCERALRPSVIFRKVTNCFRAEWGAQVYAAAASVMDTGRLHGSTALEALRDALAGVPIVQSG